MFQPSRPPVPAASSPSAADDHHDRLEVLLLLLRNALNLVCVGRHHFIFPVHEVLRFCQSLLHKVAGADVQQYLVRVTNRARNVQARRKRHHNLTAILASYFIQAGRGRVEFCLRVLERPPVARQLLDFLLVRLLQLVQLVDVHLTQINLPAAAAAAAAAICHLSSTDRHPHVEPG
eukprot:CAMPEP_0205915882 /NCGR_PEP_ID=MMETSP1325-20131115/8154_1 /ASSEMBLY_ACC=CAM_ASM_000708 /TAXON_ID=236786 /ORGANISM="Florenciella sp., Strain RCC1007" /LENGTH=175 /DNA_ID=CAMNT_0053283113 /DNA_START=179 /DNA_END=703 /DNA_ORIENTATION=+